MREVLGSVATEAGDIRALTNPDPEYPGIWVELPGEGDRQLVCVEYDRQTGEFEIMVWDHAKPDDEPVYVQYIPKTGATHVES